MWTRMSILWWAFITVSLVLVGEEHYKNWKVVSFHQISLGDSLSSSENTFWNSKISTWWQIKFPISPAQEKTHSNKAFLKCSFCTDTEETSFLSTKSYYMVAGNIYKFESFGEMRNGLNVVYHFLFLNGKWRDCSWLWSLVGLLGNMLSVVNLLFCHLTCCKIGHLNKRRTSWDSCSYFTRCFSFLFRLLSLF